jgi:hypothetical protein
MRCSQTTCRRWRGATSVCGDGEAGRAQASVLGETERALDHLAVGRRDEHASRDAARGGMRRRGRQRDEIERCVVAREGQMTLELELHHVPQLTADVGQLDRLHGDRRPGQPEGHGADAQASLVELGTECGRGLLGVDRERLEPCAVHHPCNETISEQDEGEGRAPQHHDA